MKQSEIKIQVELDDNHIPENMQWEASDTDASKPTACKAFMLSVWDEKDLSAMRVDLWTKEMKVDEMKIFFYQTLVSMADTFEKATNEHKITEDLRDYCAHFAEKMELLKEEDKQG